MKRFSSNREIWENMIEQAYGHRYLGQPAVADGVQPAYGYCRIDRLDQHGYLVDIVEVEKHLNEIVSYYREAMLNDKPEFAGLNPSLENFARILATSLDKRIQAGNINSLKVMLWENESAWAGYKVRR